MRNLPTLLLILVSACAGAVVDGAGEGEGEGEGELASEGEGEGEGDAGEGEGEQVGEGEGEGEREPPSDAGIFDGGPAPLCADNSLHNGGDGVCVAQGTCSARFALKENGQCTAWRSAPALPAPEPLPRLIVDGDRVYSVCGAGSFADSTEPANAFARIVNGELTAWELLPAFEPQRHVCAATIISGKLVAAGGNNDNLQDLSSIVVGEIDPATGAIAAWTDAGVDLILPRGQAAAFAYQGAVFVHGGYSANEIYSTFERIDLNPDGSLAAPVLLGATPDPLLGHVANVLPNGVLLAMTEYESAWTWSATGNAFPDSWAIGGGLAGLNGTCVIATEDRVVSIGGIDFFPAVDPYAVVTSSRVLTASLDDTLTRGEWFPRGNLDSGRAHGGCAHLGETIVLAGGQVDLPSGGGRVSTTSVVVSTFDDVINSVEAP